MQEILNEFSDDNEQNDISVADWLECNFNVETEPFDIEFIMKQLYRACEQ